MKTKTPFLFSLCIALLVWLVWFGYTTPETAAIIQDNWQISLTMIFGSFIAGATSEGGGAIAFPVFTKVLLISPVDAKVFSLAIQSVGMMAATLTIIFMRIAIEWRVILWASLGGIPGIVTGAAVLAPLLPADLVKISFTAMVVSFAITLSMLNWGHRKYNETLPFFAGKERTILLCTGFLGGIMSGLVGNGIDIICFSVMVLLFRLSEKVATPTSVILMAFNSVVGFCLYIFFIDGFSSQVQSYWLAAIPVVVVGAPLGAFCCTRLNNKAIASVLIGLIGIELISSLLIIPLTTHLMVVSMLILIFFSAFYYVLSKISFYRVN